MSGIMCLYITRNNKIYKIPIPNNKIHKPVPSLANEEVLFTLLYYEIINRIPSKLILADFDRIQLDSKGGYELTIDEIKKRCYNFDNYNFIDAQLLSQKDCIPIPQATIIPSTNEKEALYSYIKENFPSLWFNFPEVLECYIQNCIYNDLERRQLVKEANMLRHNILKKSTK